MSTSAARHSTMHLRRLQTLLVLMILWDLFMTLAALSFGGFFMNVDGNNIGGILAAKTTFSGAHIVPMAVYLYGLVRNPLRHPGVLWVGVIEQAAVIIAASLHVFGSDIEVTGAIAPIAVSVAFLVLLLANMPQTNGRG